jgi:hypothetical protein
MNDFFFLTAKVKKQKKGRPQLWPSAFLAPRFKAAGLQTRFAQTCRPSFRLKSLRSAALAWDKKIKSKMYALPGLTKTGASRFGCLLHSLYCFE